LSYLHETVDLSPERTPEIGCVGPCLSSQLSVIGDLIEGQRTYRKQKNHRQERSQVHIICYLHATQIER
jgi:hypothetical protein